MSVLRRYFVGITSVLLSVLAFPVMAQNADAPIQQLLQEHGEIIAKSSRKSIGPAIDALAASGLDEAQVVLERWQNKEMWMNKDTGLFVYGEKSGKELVVSDFDGGNVYPRAFSTNILPPRSIGLRFKFDFGS